MSLTQGVSILYRCGCTLSSDTPFRVVGANGNEAESAIEEHTKYKAIRDAKVTFNKQPSLAEMVSTVDLNPPVLLNDKGQPIARDPLYIVFKPLPATCAVHGESAWNSSAWAYDPGSLPKNETEVEER